MSVLFRYVKTINKFQETPTSVFQVVVGAHVLKGREDSQQRFSVKRAVVHERYVHGKGMHDIMLFQLSSKMKFGKNVRPICISDSTFAPGTQCMVTGWGSINGTSNSRYTVHHIRHVTY